MPKQPDVSMIINMAVAIVLLLMMSFQVKAELMGEIYGGGAVTQKHNAFVNLPSAGISGTHLGLKFDNAATVGGRMAYWINAFPYLGFGLDASHFFGPDQEEQTAVTDTCVIGFECYTAAEKIRKLNNNVTAIGFDLMLRYPMLISEQFAKGKLQPYLTVGPAIFVTTFKDTDNFIPAGQSSTYTSVGVKAGAGLLFFLTQRIGAFVEYRDTNFRVQDTFNNQRVVHGLTLGITNGKQTFNIQSIVGGVSFRF